MSISVNSLILNGKYRVLKKLDEGRFGHVYQIENTLTKEYFALKSISKNEIKKNSSLRQNISREIHIHRQLNHPNIVKLIETGENANRKFIILEYMPIGDIFNLLYTDLSDNSDSNDNSDTSNSSDNTEKQHHFSENEAREYIYQIIQALIYLRDLGIIHRDLKPENILISLTGEIKIADFGWAIDKPSKDNVGTTRYNSPEMIFDDKYYNHTTDLWSVGIILFEFLYGKTPYQGKNYAKIEEKIEKIYFKFPETPKVSNEVKDLIRKILVRTPTRRPTYEQILEHPWMKEYVTIQKNLESDNTLELELDSSSDIILEPISNSPSNPNLNSNSNIAHELDSDSDINSDIKSDIKSDIDSETVPKSPSEPSPNSENENENENEDNKDKINK
jgi:serine/threonine protein kinase